MKLVQYWIRRELSSFSLFRCFLVDVDEDFCDAMMMTIILMVVLMTMSRWIWCRWSRWSDWSPQSNNLLGCPGDRDPSGIAFHHPDDQWSNWVLPNGSQEHEYEKSFAYFDTITIWQEYYGSKESPASLHSTLAIRPCLPANQTHTWMFL